MSRLQKMFFPLVLCLFAFTELTGQDENDINLLNEACGFVMTEPEKAIKLADYVLKSSPEPILAYKAKLVKAKAQASKGRTDLAMEWTFNAIYDALPLGDDLAFETQMFAHHLFHSIGIPTETKHFPALNTAAEHPDDPNIPDQNKMAVALEHARLMLISEDTLNAIQHLKTAQAFATLAGEGSDIYGDPNLTLARVYREMGQLDSAAYYLNKSRQNDQAAVPSFSNWLEAEKLLLEGSLLNALGEHPEATSVLSQALSIAQELDHARLIVEINMALISAAREMDDGEKIRISAEAMYAASSAMEEIQNAAINTGHAGMIKLHSEYQNYIASQRQATKLMLWSLLIGLAVVTTVIFLQNKISSHRLGDIVKYLEASQTIQKPEAHEIKESDGARTSSFSKSTEELLIRGLEDFERSQKYLSNDMSLAQLATLLDTNTKYLSEFINLHKGKNFNTYINELRIGYIIQKIKSNPMYLNYKVSYLAEESGFSSHSNFTTVFKAITGISPTKFISLVELEKENKFSEV